MSFIWPTMLVLVLLIPLIGVLYILLQQRRRRRLAARYGGLGLATGAAGRGPGIRRHVPPALFLVGLAILIIALARPQTVVTLPRVEGTVILVVDVSGSMAADDVEPTRMEAAKAAARDFVERQPASVQIGVVAFSDGGLAVQAPTDDQEAILASINRLAPQRGTSLGQGIAAALNTIAADAGQASDIEGDLTPAPTPIATPTPAPAGANTSAVILVLSDGENTEAPDPLAVAQAAAERGVRIHTLGIGSAAGTTLDVNGFTVHTQLNEALLQQIAQLTGGAYYSAENEGDFHSVYENLVPRLVIEPQKMEVTSIFAGASILVLLMGGTFSLLWFSRLP